MGRKKRPIQAAEPVRTIDALVNRAQALATLAGSERAVVAGRRW